MDEQFWNDRYSTSGQLWSGAPNGLLVAEVDGMAPGSALDLGCGEGADALWLAGRGWQVTAVDISRVALDRATAADPAGAVKWAQGDVSVTPPPPAAFDLVAALYFPLPKQPGHRALLGVLAAVAPGGTLLFGSHDLTDWHDHHDHDSEFDPADYYMPDEIAAVLGKEWTIEVNEIRARVSPAPPGTQHINDALLRARRTG